MGRRIASLAIQSERFDIVSALEFGGSEHIGKDVGELAGEGVFGVEVGDKLTENPQVLDTAMRGIVGNPDVAYIAIVATLLLLWARRVPWFRKPAPPTREITR